MACGQQLRNCIPVEFDQEHVTKNQPITVLILLSESLAISKLYNNSNYYLPANNEPFPNFPSCCPCQLFFLLQLCLFFTH